MRYVCLFPTILLLFVLPAHGASNVFRAGLVCDSCDFSSAMTIELTDLNRNHVGSGIVSSNGECEISSVPPGTYRVIVLGGRGEILREDVVAVNGFGAPVQIRMPEKKVERPVSGVISVQRLQHKVPKKARKEYERAEDAMEKGDVEKSIRHLEKAVRLDPEYVEALNNLGARYMRLNQHEKAVASFQAAIELDPSATVVQQNLAAALIAVGDPKSAELTIRRSLEQSNNVKGRYLLGLALYQQKQYDQETVDLLQSCEDQFPNARLALAVVQANMGNRELAREALQSYIANEQAPNRQQAMAMLTRLQ